MKTTLAIITLISALSASPLVAADNDKIHWPFTEALAQARWCDWENIHTRQGIEPGQHEARQFLRAACSLAPIHSAQNSEGGRNLATTHEHEAAVEFWVARCNFFNGVEIACGVFQR